MVETAFTPDELDQLLARSRPIDFRMPAPNPRRLKAHTREQWKRYEGMIWQHRSGWQVHHCGHPTAHWPYYIVKPDGTCLFAHNGRGFRHLRDAQKAAEAALAKKAG